MAKAIFIGDAHKKNWYLTNALGINGIQLFKHCVTLAQASNELTPLIVEGKLLVDFNLVDTGVLAERYQQILLDLAPVCLATIYVTRADFGIPEWAVSYENLHLALRK